MSDIFPTQKDYLTGLFKLTATGAILAGCFFLFFSGFGVSSPDAWDEEAQVTLLTNRMGHVDFRLQSIEALAAINPERLMKLLVNIVKEPMEEPWFRYRAAERMVRLDKKEAKRIFEEWLDNRKMDGFVRKSAITQLAICDKVDLKLKKIIPKILADATEDPSIRQFALSLYVTAHGKKALPQLREIALNKREPVPMRADALSELEFLEDSEFVRETLRQNLKSRTEPEDLRKTCLDIVGNMKDQGALSLLFDIAADKDESPALRKLALVYLSPLADKKMLPGLRACCEREKDSVVRKAFEDTLEAVKTRLDALN